MARFRLLSYNLDKTTFTYGGKKPVIIKEERSIKKGDTCNTFLLSLPNHIGTHIEAPRHFFAHGKCLTRYNINELVFKKPLVINCPKGKSRLIEAEDIDSFSHKLNRADIVLFKTGFGRLRNKKDYAVYNPGISPCAAHLIKEKFPNIRCVGIDSISVSCCQKRLLGRQTHRILLGSGILIIEDMKLDFNLSGLLGVIAAPLLIEGLDAACCTVLGIFKESR